jgi:hypothetical protein
MMTRALLWVAVVLALAGAIPGTARADWDDRPDPGEFQQSLDPNGYWVDDSQFGHVWRPPVAWGWQPYVDGQWVWTTYGWTWTSPEPWGWTFHYGRWGFSNLYGWVWTPGYVWGPAWVNWYWGDGFVGWAPLGPPGFVVVPTYWNYVHDWSFCSPHVQNVFVGHQHLPNYVVHHQDQGWGMRHAPDLRDIERVSRHQIVRENDRPRGSIAPWVEHRIERGERVRERVASRDGDRFIEHPGHGPERGDAANDGWRGNRQDGRHDVQVGPGPHTPESMTHGGHATQDDGRVSDQGPHRRIDDGNMAPRRQGRDQSVWARPAPPPSPYSSSPQAPHVIERPAPPSMGYHAGGNGGGNPGGAPHSGGGVMQHGNAGGAPHGGGGQQHGGGSRGAPGGPGGPGGGAGGPGGSGSGAGTGGFGGGSGLR